MIQYNPLKPSEFNQMLVALDHLYKQQMNLIKDMQGHAVTVEAPQTAWPVSAFSAYTDVHLTTPEPEGINLSAARFERQAAPVEPEKINLSAERFERQLAPVEPEEINRSAARFEPQLAPVEPEEINLFAERFEPQPAPVEPAKFERPVLSVSEDENAHEIQASCVDNVQEASSVLSNNSMADAPEPEKNEQDTNKKPIGKKRSIRKFMSAASFYGFLVLLMVGSLLISQGNKRPIFNYYFMNVLTWSMQSEIPQGSLVVVKQIDPDTIEIGDDITYMLDSETSVTHRVIGITENFENSGERGFETQGIENDTADFNLVPAANVMGKVIFHIPMLGNWLEWLREHLIINLLFTVGVVVLIVLIKNAFKKA